MKFAKRIILLFVLIQFVISLRNENESETVRKQDMRNRSSLMKNKINKRKDIIGNTCNCEELKKEIKRLKELNNQLMNNNSNQMNTNNQIQGNNISANSNPNQNNVNINNNQIQTNGNLNTNQINANQMNNQSSNVNQNNATPNNNTNQNHINDDSGELSTGSTQNTNQNQQQRTSLNNNQHGNNNINPMNQKNQQSNTNIQPQMNINQVQSPQNNFNNCNQPTDIYIPETSFDPSATTRIIESQRQAERQAKLSPLLKCFSPYNPYTTIITNTNSQCETCCHDTLQSNPKSVNCCIEKCIVDSNSQSKYSLFCINYKFIFNTVQISIPEL